MAMWPHFILLNLNFTSVMSMYHWGFQSVVEKNRTVIVKTHSFLQIAFITSITPYHEKQTRMNNCSHWLCFTTCPEENVNEIAFFLVKVV